MLLLKCYSKRAWCIFIDQLKEIWKIQAKNKQTIGKSENEKNT